MRYEICPIVYCGDIEIEIADKLNEWNHDFVAPILFGEEYSNDSYKSFHIKEDEVYRGYQWEDKELIEQRNYIRKFLRDNLPKNTDKVLVDVSW